MTFPDIQPDKSNRDAFVRYVTENQNQFYRLAYSYVRNRETALDTVQNAIVSGLKNLDSLRSEAVVKTWFYRILINTCIDELRRSKNLIPTDPFSLPEQQADQGPDKESLLDLHEALSSMDESSRTIIALRYFEDMKINDVAEVLGQNVSTVKTKLYRALEKLKSQLQATERSGDLK